MTGLYIPILHAAAKRNHIPIKCSTCADKRCPVRGTVVDWQHCSKWLPEGQLKENPKRL